MSRPKEEMAASSAEQTLELVRLLEGARDALNDDMVGRLSATVGDGMDLLDRVNRSGVGEALPAITALVENGDLERLVHLARVIGAAEDALSDDMIGRLSNTAGDGMDLLDRVNRSGVVRALPAITQLVENGDMERIVHLARVLGSMEDAVNDEMISRLAAVAGEAISLMDRLTRNDALTRVMDLLLREEVQSVLVRLGEALVESSREFEQQPPPKGGL
ncbi:MAG TPA: hypothetical protein VK971_12850, partial [Thiohalobacter sp.]|nr:hypothetical protein [Thiohalobacter sp.]